MDNRDAISLMVMLGVVPRRYRIFWELFWEPLFISIGSVTAPFGSIGQENSTQIPEDA
jgi:hypothetical protein